MILIRIGLDPRDSNKSRFFVIASSAMVKSLSSSKNFSVI